MDEFAQSREDDDLFSDELEPVAETNNEKSSTRGNADVGDAPAANNKPSAGPRNGRGGARGGQDQRRGGRGGRGTGSGGLGSSRYASQSTAAQSTTIIPKPDIANPGTSKTSITTPSEPSATAETISPSETVQAPAPALSIATATAAVDDSTNPTQSSPQPVSEPQQPARPAAVRGDRHLTGGPAHKKLTEAELSEKMEKMKILNAQKAERFRLSEEDSAAYARKEKEMAKKRVEEQKNARAMDMERAKNRQRKLAAQGGREWDSEKQESDIVDGRGRGRSSEYVRGGHGGVIRGGLAASNYAQADGAEGEGARSARGRGGFEGKGRGNRGGRVSVRGGKPSPATVPTKEDFPELPIPTKPLATEIAKGTEKVKSPAMDKPGGDWAEEMATPAENKELDI